MGLQLCLCSCLLHTLLRDTTEPLQKGTPRLQDPNITLYLYPNYMLFQTSLVLSLQTPDILFSYLTSVSAVFVPALRAPQIQLKGDRECTGFLLSDCLLIHTAFFAALWAHRGIRVKQAQT